MANANMDQLDITTLPTVSVSSQPICATGSVWPWGHPTNDDRYSVRNTGRK